MHENLQPVDPAPHPRAFEFTEERLTNAMASAMRQVLTDPVVIESMGAVAIQVIQRQAAQRTGNFMLRAVKAALSRWVVIGFILLLLSKFVGVPTALSVWASVSGKTTP